MALHLGHRESVDFDWFFPSHLSLEKLRGSLEMIGNLEVSTEREGTFHGFLDGVQVTWLYYQMPLLQPLTTATELNFHLASLEDIGVMKLVAVSQRGAKKDFVDLYQLAKSGFEIDKTGFVMIL